MSKGSVPAEIHGPEIPNIDRSLWSMLEDTAKAHPNSEAVVSLWQTSEHIIGDNPLLKAGDEVPLRWSYSQLLYHVQTLATWLYTCGCRPGANMVVFAWNSAEWALFFWAAARLSMPFVPLDPLSLGKQDGGPLEETHSAVLVVPDEETARRFEERSILPPAQAIKIQIICSHTVGLPSWVSLYSVFTRSAAITESIELPPARTSPKGGHGKDVALIVFTSGTTNLPKGCVHSSANLWSETHVYDPSLRLQPGHRSLIHTPVSSISGINHVLRAWRGGASVVFPSRIFDPTATVNALSVERCTHVAIFPPMIQALAAVLALQSKTRPNLEFVTLIGQTISQDDIEKCKDVLRCKKAMQAYGLSEGAPVCSWSQDDPLLIQGYHEGVGKVLPGARVKICNPGERDSLRRGEPGELHVGGTSIVSGYLGGRHASSFYGDAEMTWFRTGDQAVMDEKDVIHIVGRYKDIIIRLGQNLAPARIEACIESFSGVKANVIGVPDTNAGEVPVAVLQLDRELPDVKADIRDFVVQQLGSFYSLHAIFTLEELGLQCYPMTATGKVRKGQLKELVISYIGTHTHTYLDSPETTAAALRNIWAGLLGLPRSEIPLDEPLSHHITDINLLKRFCATIRNQFGKSFRLQDFRGGETINQQALLLNQRPLESKSGHTEDVLLIRDGPPSYSDMAHTHGDPLIGERTIAAVRPVLQEFGLSWESDVEDIIPITDSYSPLTQGVRPQTGKVRFAAEVANANAAHLRAALERTLAHHTICRAILVNLDARTPLHVILRATKSIFNIIVEQSVVESSTNIVEMVGEDSSGNFPQNPMFLARIYHIQKTESTGLLLTLNHSIFDAPSLYSFYEDLHKCIGDMDAHLTARTPFKCFADMYYLQRESLAMKPAVDFHVRRLRGISKFCKSLWPVQKAPGWMIGNDSGFIHAAARDEARKTHPDQRPSYPILVNTERFPYFSQLKSELGIGAHIAVKTALAIFNVYRTGEAYAIFANLDAARRTWPGQPSWVADCLPSPLEIQGPTLTSTMNMIRVDGDESLDDLMRQVKAEQTQLSRYAHAPLFKIKDGLAEEGPLLSEAISRQMFNWYTSPKYSTGLLSDLEARGFRLLARRDYPDRGFTWSCTMVDSERLHVAALWDNAQITSGEAASHVECLFRIIGWITQPENWQKPVRHCLDYLASTASTVNA